MDILDHIADYIRAELGDNIFTDARRAAPKKSKPPFFPPIPKYPGW